MAAQDGIAGGNQTTRLSSGSLAAAPDTRLDVAGLSRDDAMREMSRAGWVEWVDTRRRWQITPAGRAAAALRDLRRCDALDVAEMLGLVESPPPEHPRRGVRRKVVIRKDREQADA